MISPFLGQPIDVAFCLSYTLEYLNMLTLYLVGEVMQWHLVIKDTVIKFTVLSLVGRLSLSQRLIYTKIQWNL